MRTLKRTIEDKILNKLNSNKVIVLLGVRRVGKSVLLKQITSKIKTDYLLLNGEDINVKALFETQSVQNFKNLLGNKRLLIIDEAQSIENIGQKLKLMIDEIEDMNVLITGSSAFDISNKTGEPLTGRKYTFYLYPFCEHEYNQIEDIIQKPDNLKHRLIYGNYPELIHLNSNEEKQEYLSEIVNSYLLKDILTFENIKNSSKILNLLRLISWQTGSEVSYNELGKKLGMSKNTVEKYLDLLSKVFILFKVEGFSRNLRKEVVKSSKWYFYDNGIRNALIANFQNIELRNDIGILWENYIISERIKYQAYNNIVSNNYFWRTYDKQEIDWIEEREGNLYAYEFKWNKTAKIPLAFSKAYPDAKFEVINKNNYLVWINQ
ncbi:MAG: ATPase [Bacteroidetes bacterium]|nr:MAG: ATPase [Bacteroidota bacterium]